MEYSRIHDLSISKYTLGTVQLGTSYGIANKSGQPDMEKSFEMLRVALQAGINALDMSPAYGTAEEVVGKFLKTRPASESSPLLVTKFRIDPAEDVSPAGIEKQIRTSVETSLQRLDIASLPILLLHKPEDLFAYGPSISAALTHLKQEGLIAKAGVSVYSGADVEEMLKDSLYEAVQIPMNILDSRLPRKGLIQKLKENGYIVFVRSIFLQGLLFLNPEELPPYLSDAKEPLTKLRSLAQEENISVAQLALAYIRDMDGITSLVIGAETPEQVRDNVGLIELPGISAALRSRIETLFENIPNHVLNPHVWNRPELWDEIDKMS